MINNISILVTNYVIHNFDLTHFTGINNRKKNSINACCHHLWFRTDKLFKSAKWMYFQRCRFAILTWLIFSVNSRVIIATLWRYRNVIISNLKLFGHSRIKNWKKYILGLKDSNLCCLKLFSNWVATCMLRFENIFAFEFYSFTICCNYRECLCDFTKNN